MSGVVKPKLFFTVDSDGVNGQELWVSGGALDGVFWGHIGVIALWVVIAVGIAWRTFHWEPRRSAG